MFWLEELTSEELISWIRENVSDLDEGNIVLQVMKQRQKRLQEIRDNAFSQIEETNNQVVQLVQKYADGPVKPGVKLRWWPVEAAQEYKRLDQLGQEAKSRYYACLREERSIEWKIISIRDEQIKQQRKQS